MGGRGAFLNVDKGDFRFCTNGQVYHTIGHVDDIEIIQRDGKTSVCPPELSHKPNQKYAVVKNGKLKYISFYDKNHKQIKCIDLLHRHNHMFEHYHVNLMHDNEHTFRATQEDINLANKIRKAMKIL